MGIRVGKVHSFLFHTPTSFSERLASGNYIFCFLLSLPFFLMHYFTFLLIRKWISTSPLPLITSHARLVSQYRSSVGRHWHFFRRNVLLKWHTTEKNRIAFFSVLRYSISINHLRILRQQHHGSMFLYLASSLLLTAIFTLNRMI